MRRGDPLCKFVTENVAEPENCEKRQMFASFGDICVAADLWACSLASEDSPWGRCVCHATVRLSHANGQLCFYEGPCFFLWSFIVGKMLMLTKLKHTNSHVREWFWEQQ